MKITSLLFVALCTFVLTASAQWPGYTKSKGSGGGGGGAGNPATPTNSVQYNSGGVFGGSSNFLWVSPLLTVGGSGTTGQIGMAGATSVVVTMQPATAAGTWTLTLPTSAGSANQFLQTNSSCVTTWAAGAGGGTVTAVTGTAPIASSGGTTPNITWTGATINGTSVVIGDLLYGSASTAYSNLADVATGNALISGGVATAPSWGKIGLATHVSGNLPVTNLNS